jgi:hypothetical protein
MPELDQQHKSAFVNHHNTQAKRRQMPGMNQQHKSVLINNHYSHPEESQMQESD